MSLQIWLPLNGDLHNQGINENIKISSIGTLTFVNNGKIGKCYQRAINNTQITTGININNNLLNLLGTKASVAMWVKPLGTHTHYNGTLLSSGNWNAKRWAFGISQDNTKVDVLCGGYNTYINCEVPVNEWTHLCSTFDNGVSKLYKNGIYIGQLTGQAAFDSDATNTCIGRETYANGYFGFNGLINDVRIYNNVLSEKQIKEISKGLILHYPLNRRGWGQDNLATCGTQMQLLSAGITNNYCYFWVNNNTLEPNTTYTFSAICSSNNLDKCTIYNYTDSGKSGSIYHNFPVDGKKHSWTFTTTATAVGLIAYAGNSGSTGSHSIMYENIKIEKGNKMTAWCPKSTEDLYSTMQIGNNIQYDISGYGNNGIRYGIFTWSFDSPTYQVSTGAIGSASTYLRGPILPSTAQTVSLWIKGAKSNNAAIFNDRIAGLQIGLLNSLLYVNSLAATAGFTTTHWKNNEWNHVVVVNNNGTRSVYINGQAEIQSGASNYYIHQTDYCWLWNRSYNNNYPFSGSLSDFRIYVTALSAEDVLSLYNNGAYIDQLNEIHGKVR